jgi:methyl-accepting chemotaxis protein
LTFQSNSLGILTSRVNTQADSISGVMTDVDNLADTVSNFSSSIGSITTLTDNVNSLTSQVSTISSRAFANMQQISTSRNHIEALQPIVASHTTSISSINTSLTDIQSSITSLEQGGSSSGLQTQIDTLRTDTDANTLLGSQLLTALQYQSTTIFAIDTAIQISNGKVAILETTQITQDNLIREFDQLFNEPANGVVDKLNNIISTYNTHISGVYLTLRRNVDDNNLILGTLSTNTTSLLTAMTQIYSRVQVLEDNEPPPPPPPSNFDFFDRYPSTNYVSGGVIQTSSNITVEQALEIGLTISNLHAIVHNVGGTTFFCGAGGNLVTEGQSVNRTTFVKK